LGDFMFLDPLDNLLLWSEKLDEAVWERNLLLQITSEIADPNGGTSASTVANTSTSALAITQTVNAPGWFQYAFAVQARSDAAQQLTLHRSTATQTQSASFGIGPSWQRVVLSGKFTGTEEAVVF